MVIQYDATLTQKHVDDTQRVVENLLSPLDSSHMYHNLSHTEQVTRYAQTIMKLQDRLGWEQHHHFPVQEPLLFVQVLALWHDTGFSSKYAENEPWGARRMRTYMESTILPYNLSHTALGTRAILCTSRNRNPASVFDRVLLDADTAYLGTDWNTFITWSQKLELESRLHAHESPLADFAGETESWWELEISFLEHHQWYTEAGQQLYDDNKQHHLKKLKQLRTDNNLPHLLTE